MSTQHILVVDDEPEIAESLADFLAKTAKYRVTIANDGHEAIDFLKSTVGTAIEIDLVLLDMRMPEISGLDVLSWIRSHPVFQYTRVVLLTAAAGSNEKVEALSAGADDYITKPYYPQELLARVKTILRTQQLEKQLQRQSQQLAELNRVGRRVAALLNQKEMLATAVSGVNEVIGVELAAILMIENGRLHCQHLYSHNQQFSNDDYPTILPGQGITGKVLAQKTAVLTHDPHQDSRFAAHLDAPHGFKLKALIVVPLIVRGRPVGTLHAFNKRSGAFTEVDLDLLSSLAISVSETIENTWLFQRIRLRQQELLESRNTLQALIDGILHHIYTINDNWKLVSINQSKANNHNTTSEALAGAVCYKAFFGRNTPCDHCCVGQTLTAKEPQQWSLTWTGPDHLPREREIHAYPIPGTQAGSARAVIVWQDRTEERRLENSLRQASKLAAIGQLAAGVAHEINNPLTAINANAQILQMLIPKEDENYESVDLIARAGERAAKVVRGLLDFSRQEHLSFTPNSINISIQQAVDLVSYQLQTANISVIPNMAPNLPAITASWEHLKTVWINLIINARDAVQDRAITEPTDVNGNHHHIEITTRLGDDAKHIEVIIHDTGKGMSAAELKHIFEPFYTTKAPSKGTGLGLATSHRIIEQHQGEINVASTQGQGTTFFVRLPINVAQK